MRLYDKNKGEMFNMRKQALPKLCLNIFKFIGMLKCAKYRKASSFNSQGETTLRILIVGYSRLRIVLDNNVSDNSFIIGNISRHYRQNRIIGRRLRGGAFLKAVTRNFLVT